MKYLLFLMALLFSGLAVANPFIEGGTYTQNLNSSIYGDYYSITVHYCPKGYFSTCVNQAGVIHFKNVIKTGFSTTAIFNYKTDSSCVYEYICPTTYNIFETSGRIWRPACLPVSAIGWVLPECSSLTTGIYCRQPEEYLTCHPKWGE